NQQMARGRIADCGLIFAWFRPAPIFTLNRRRYLRPAIRKLRIRNPQSAIRNDQTVRRQHNLRREYKTLASLPGERPRLEGGPAPCLTQRQFFPEAVLAEPGCRRPVAFPVVADQHVQFPRGEELDLDGRDGVGPPLRELQPRERRRNRRER